ncbi:MAG: murein biosynthesis integral membrane protein MurJ [Candidatus Blackburnbacteria bacterium]|nr:murein biosynthesis integral membrane protein MurJ [Candidatus Blackburnbacteria bacterium]
MVETLLLRGKNILASSGLKKSAGILYGRQANILSAATVIMIMIAASRLLGLARNRVFVHYFPPQELDTYLAAFQFPDLIFEIFVLGAMSSAFIPIFTRSMAQKKAKEAWYLAGLVLNVMIFLFLVMSLAIFVFAAPMYGLVAQGFTKDQIAQTVLFTRALLVAQMFFAASYVITAVLESNQRFLAPAVAPLFYNLGIILMTVFFAPELGLYAPVWGAVIGSFLHLAIQVPLALRLGFRPVWSLNFKDPRLKQIGKLALPRIVELSVFQAKRLVDLFLASLVVGGLTYFKFGDSMAVLPTSLFGLSIAKASLPSFALSASKKGLEDFKATFSSSFRQIIFFVLPASVFLAVLRLPIVRLAFGGTHFEWEDTLQTGYVLSAFAIGIFAYSLSLLISRGFYALHDTLTPVKVSFVAIGINVILELVLVLVFKTNIWGLALAYSVAGIVQFAILFFALSKRIGGFGQLDIGHAFAKVLAASSLSGALMFFLLKVLDRSAWDKKLSFLGQLGLALPAPFERIVLDTHYTSNLIVLTFVVFMVGLVTYLATTWFLGIRELDIVLKALRRVSVFLRFKRPTPFPSDTVVSPQTNGTFD